jgi:hypothetical protein
MIAPATAAKDTTTQRLRTNQANAQLRRSAAMCQQILLTAEQHSSAQAADIKPPVQTNHTSVDCNVTVTSQPNNAAARRSAVAVQHAQSTILAGTAQQHQ